MRILAFGIAKELLGGGITDVNVAGDVTVGMLKGILLVHYPGLAKLSSFMIAVNNEYASEDKVITSGDELAIIPPVSGG